MASIELDKPARESLSRLLADHLRDELAVEIAPFDALALVDFLAETVGPYFYNQGLYDAQVVVKDRADAIIEAISAIEKPVKR